MKTRIPCYLCKTARGVVPYGRHCYCVPCVGKLVRSLRKTAAERGPRGLRARAKAKPHLTAAEKHERAWRRFLRDVRRP